MWNSHFHPLRLVLLTTVLAALLGGCLRASKDRAATTAISASLLIRGTVYDDIGAPLENVFVYVDDEPESATATDIYGQFSVNLNNHRLSRFQHRLAGSTQTFRIYFESSANPNLVGASEPIEAAARGERVLGDIHLQEGAAISGKILLASNAQSAAAAVGARIRLGRHEIMAGSNGQFQADRIPVSTNIVHVSYPAYADTMRPLSLQTGQATTLPHPIVLFPGETIAGALFLDASAPPEEEASAAHPFMQRFFVEASRNVRYIRYSHDRERLLGGELGWHEVPSSLDYDFPHDGGNTLYFQFSDATQTIFSALYQVSTIIDQYAGTGGIVIEDGSGVASSRTVLVNVDIPKVAYRMRLAESREELLAVPWQTPAPIVPYTFSLRANLSTHQLEATGLRELYAQFVDAHGFESPVYRAAVTLETFPRPETEMFVINGGAAETQNRYVALDIQVPPNAAEMRIFEAPSPGDLDLGSPWPNGGDTRDLWLNARSQSFYVFGSSGMKTLYIQFRAADGGVSPVYHQAIRILPYPPTGERAFVINGGAPAAASRHLAIDLLPPPGTIQFKIWDAEDNELLAPWRTIMPNLLFSANWSGLRTILVKFRNEDFEESGAYAESILIDPFPPGSSYFMINGGSGYTISPLLALTIMPPPAAAYYAVAEGVAPDLIPSFSPDNWVEIPQGGLPFVVPFEVRHTGSKTIFVRFLTPDGELSLGALQESVFYDPFPEGSASILLDNGAAATSSTTVNVKLAFPPTHTKMRLASDPLILQSMPFAATVSSTSFTLPPALGVHKVYVQFETPEGERSPVYFDEIIKQ